MPLRTREKPLDVLTMSDTPQRFLVIRLSSIGDIVHALPAVAALGETYRQAEIDWVVENRYACLLEGNPYVKRLRKIDTLGWREKRATAANWEEAARSILALREVSYDAAIDFQGLWKSALIAWLSRARERLGLAEYWLREPGAALFYSQKVSAGNRKHIVEVNLALVERLGARVGRWQFPLPRAPEDDLYVERQLAALGAKEFIIINPGGGWRAKCWAPENYAELLRRLEARFPWKILLTGSPNEEKLVANIIALAGTKQACHVHSTLLQFIALARRAKLFVGGDTGPLHLAAAIGTPIVAIYGPTDPARNGPFAEADIALSNRGPIDHTRRLSSPSYLAGISVDSVMAAIHERLTRGYG